MRQASLKSLLQKATMERFNHHDAEEDADFNSMSTSDLLASLGMPNKSMRSSKGNLNTIGSSSHLLGKGGQQMKDPEMTGIMDLQDLSMAEIHQKFAEIYDENNLLRVSLQAEINIREKLEKKNREITEKLADTRQGLQETRTALINLQSVTEDLIQRKEEREMQLQKVVSISKTYERRIAELETNSVRSEEVAKLHSIISSTKLAVMEKEESMQQLEQQIVQLQNAVRTARNDVQVAIEEKKFVEVKLQHAGDKINQLDSALEKQKDKTADVQKANMSLEATISALRDKMADMQMAKVNIETLKMGLESSNSKQKERISDLTTAKQELENKVGLLNRSKMELEHKVQELQATLESKRLAESVVGNIIDSRASTIATGQRHNELENKVADMTKERSGLEERMLALEKMLTSLPMLSNGSSSGPSPRNIPNGGMNRTPSQQRIQQQPSAGPSRNGPSNANPNSSVQPPSGGKLARQPSLRKSLGQNVTPQDNDDILYDTNPQEARARFASGSSGDSSSNVSISRSDSQQDFVPLVLPLGARTKTQSMDDGSNLRSKADSMDSTNRSKASSVDDTTSDQDVRFAVERTARALLQGGPGAPPSSSPSSILRKTIGGSVAIPSTPSNNNNNTNNSGDTPTNSGTRVSFSLDNNSVHMIPNKEKDSRSSGTPRSKERDGDREEREKEKDRQREEREKEKDRQREEREKEKEKEKERQREEREKEKEKERQQKEKERREREDQERRNKEEKEKEREKQQRDEEKRREKERKDREAQQQRDAEQREREKREKEEREQRDEEQRDKEKEKEPRERSSESRSRKSMVKTSSSKSLDPAASAAMEQVKEMKTEINNLISQHREYKNKIKEFTDKFKAEHNGAEPSKDDRKNLAGETFKTYEKLSKQIKKKMKDLETFQAANNGIGRSSKIIGPGTPSTKLQSFQKSSKSPRTDDDDGSVSTDDSDDS